MRKILAENTQASSSASAHLLTTAAELYSSSPGPFENQPSNKLRRSRTWRGAQRPGERAREETEERSVVADNGGRVPPQIVKAPRRERVAAACAAVSYRFCFSSISIRLHQGRGSEVRQDARGWCSTGDCSRSHYPSLVHYVYSRGSFCE